MATEWNLTEVNPLFMQWYDQITGHKQIVVLAVALYLPLCAVSHISICVWILVMWYPGLLWRFSGAFSSSYPTATRLTEYTPGNKRLISEICNLYYKYHLVLFHHDHYHNYWDAYFHCYSLWVSDFGILNRGNFGTAVVHFSGSFYTWIFI